MVWTTAFVPAVVDLVAPTPVLAAGGIADGRGLAAALVLGASGAVIGTRFQATAEAVVDPAAKKAIVDGRGQDTERNSILDIASGSRWPPVYPARTLGHPVLGQWRGRGGAGLGRRPRGPKPGPAGLPGRCGGRRRAAAAGLGRGSCRA